MPNFIKKIFTTSSESTSTADTSGTKEVRKEGSRVHSIIDSPRPAVKRLPRRKQSSSTRKYHDLDPTIEMATPSFDSMAVPPVKRAVRKEASNGSWNDPTTEVFLPA